MTYTVLARRYRSRDFDEIVGQKAIAGTLRSAIEQNRIAHAYLFCGTRGVGKTSMARIFAKALNATDDLVEQREIGDAIMRGEDLDVIEIDGASNRGIQEARDLIAGAGLAPSRCHYKIYIIDEVHMLTKPAFNALLKTMEEPPEHVKFILATTDPHNVPATIQSRCQRFDFRSLTTDEVATQLRMILHNESVAADDDVVHHVARLGNGSMRDALSILDRLLATGQPSLTMPVLQETLGLPDQALVLQLVDAVVGTDPATALNTVRELLANGASPEQVLDLLAEYFRDLMVIRTCGPETDLVDLAGESRSAAAAHAECFDVPALVHLIAMADAVGRNARTATTARALIDAAIVRMCLSEHFASVAGALAGRVDTKASAEKKKPRAELTSHARSKPAQTATPATRPNAASTETAPSKSATGTKSSATKQRDRAAPSTPPARPRVTEVKPAHTTAPSKQADEGSPRRHSVELKNMTVADWNRAVAASTLSESQSAQIARITFLETSVGGPRPIARFAPTTPRRFATTRLERLIRDVLGREDLVVEFIWDKASVDADESTSSDAPDSVRTDPLVAEALDLFDGHIANIERLDNAPDA